MVFSRTAPPGSERVAIATAAAPAAVEGEQVPLSVDLSGNLRTSGGGGGGGTVDQGNPAVVANAWPVKITDGVDILLVNADGSGLVDVTDRDGRLLGRAKILNSAGAVIDVALQSQLPAALVGGRLDITIGGVAVTVPVSSAAASQVDGHSVAIGATTDAEAAGNGSVIALLKRLRTLLAGGLPAALVGGRLDVNLGAYAAHDAVATGNPVQVGSVASLNEPTEVADADAVRHWVDRFGRQVVLIGHANPEAPVTANGSGAGVSVIGAPGASLSLYICKGSVHSSAAAEQLVSLRDGAAGTVRWTANLAADGGGSIFDFGSRGWKLTANTALVMDAGAATAYCNITEYYIAP